MENKYAGLLQGQVALITGGAQGIGGAAATAFSMAGAKVFIVALGQDAIDKKVAEIRANGFEAAGYECDVTDYEGMQTAVQKCEALYGKLDILYANAGVVLQRKSILDSDVARWKKTIEIDMIGGYITAKAALPLLLKNENGAKILFTGTGRGRRGGTDLSDYSCAKAGQWMLARCLAMELREHNICVNEIIPGPVDTALNKTDDGTVANKDLTSSGEINKSPEALMDIMMFVATQSNITGPTAQSFALNRREI